MSHTPRWLLSIALIAGLSLAAYAMTGDQPPPDAHCVEVPELGVYVCGTTTSTTSTSLPPETSTTTEPSTTTSTSTVTTTTVPGLVIPPTLPPDDPNFQANESFTIMTACLANRDGTPNECGTTTQQIAEFDYLGHGLPYLYPGAEPGNMDHAWWVAGDREAYACGYGFMYDQHPNPFGMFAEPRPAEFIARFTIVRPFGQAYGGVNDRFMDEAERYYDGSPADEGREITSESCRLSSLDPDFDYAAYEPHGPDQIRVGLFRSDGAIADIRDFTQVELGMAGHFEFISLEDGRVSIVFIIGTGQKVSHVFYYDALNSGRIAVEVNGTTIGE